MFKRFVTASLIVACSIILVSCTIRVKSFGGNDRDVIKSDIDDIKKSTSIHEITGDLSPNYASRITGAKPEMIILHHTISNTASIAVDWFEEQDSKISAHSTWNHHLKEPILSSLKDLIQELNDKELSALYNSFNFDDKFSDKLSEFYVLVDKAFQNQFHEEFMPEIRSIGWSQLHEESLKYVEDELLKYKNS
jgi:hypothetical protein